MGNTERNLAWLQIIVDEQAEDEGLWFVAATAPEAYLQQELRRLHEAIESVSLIDGSRSPESDGGLADA